MARRITDEIRPLRMTVRISGAAAKPCATSTEAASSFWLRQVGVDADQHGRERSGGGLKRGMQQGWRSKKQLGQNAGHRVQGAGGKKDTMSRSLRTVCRS